MIFDNTACIPSSDVHGPARGLFLVRRACGPRAGPHTFTDDNYFGRYLGSFRPVKEPWQKKAGKTRKKCKGQKMADKRIKITMIGRKRAVKLTGHALLMD
jgi:hypothetical protein